MSLQNEMRRRMWREYPRYGIVDRLFLASGPIGIVLLFVDWRIGLGVLILGVPILWWLSRRELARAVRIDLGLVDESGRPLPTSEARTAFVDRQSTPVAADFARNMARNTAVVDSLAADWAERDGYGNPRLSLGICFWDMTASSWKDGEIVAVLTAGTLTPEPNLRLEIFDGDDCLFSWSNAVWLVERLDLDYSQPAHEMRGSEWDATSSTNVPQRLLFITKGPGLSRLDSYLSAYGPDPVLWLEMEPEEWRRLAPPDPTDAESKRATSPPESEPRRPVDVSTPSDESRITRIDFDPMLHPTETRAKARHEFIAKLPPTMPPGEMYSAWIAHAGQLKTGGALAGRVREVRLEEQAVWDFANERDELLGL